MFTWIIQISIISIIFIYLVNHLIIFFKSTLTIPKIKDLINTSNQKYQNIYDTISHNSSGQSYTSIDLLPKTNDKNDINDINAINDIKGINVNGINVNGNGINVGKNAMKDELKSFLKKQLNNNNDNDNDVIGFDSSNSFSNF
jgi:hypothetical protein